MPTTRRILVIAISKSYAQLRVVVGEKDNTFWGEGGVSVRGSLMMKKLFVIMAVSRG